MKQILCLEFVKTSKIYKSNHGNEFRYIFFKDNIKGKSYRTAIYNNMRNFNNWREVIEKAERGDYIDNLFIKLYKGKPIIDADSRPKLITAKEMLEIKNDLFEQEYGIPYC